MTSVPTTDLVVKGGEDVAVYLKADPDRVLLEAHKAAVALQGVIASKPKKVVFNGQQYIQSEDWITLGRFYDVTAAAESDPEYVEMGGFHGFKATFVALRGGEVISRATAFCMTDEEKWGSRPKYEWHYVRRSDGGTQLEDPGKDELIWDVNQKTGKSAPKKAKVRVGDEQVPLYQVASMAQTRACSKVLAQVLKWVVVLAGYSPTPAEEMDGMAQVVEAEVVTRREPGEDGETVMTSVGPVVMGSGSHAKAASTQPDPAAQVRPVQYDNPGKAPAKATSRGSRPPCPTCSSNAKVIDAKYKRDKGVWYCMADKTTFGPPEAQTPDGDPARADWDR